MQKPWYIVSNVENMPSPGLLIYPDRVRKNIERAPKESETFKRYLKKFDDQETEIEKRQAKLKELKADLAKHVKALKDYAESAKAE